MILKLAWKNIWFKPLNTLLSIILLSSSVAIITILILIQEQFEKKFNNNIDNIDLVLGAQGSPLQLVLSSVFQLDAPTGNINYQEAKKWMTHPFVKTAIPLAYGDNLRGFKILGTNSTYFVKNKLKLAKGNFNESNFEVVLGAQVAQALKLQLGDTFYGSHGDVEQGEIHDHQSYKVVGILKPSTRVADQLIFCNIESVWQMHHHDPSVEIDPSSMEITAVLLEFKNKMSIVSWPRLIAKKTKMQATSPIIQINRIITLLGVGVDALKYLAYSIMLISGISIFIALYNLLKERKYEFALLRVSGASKNKLFSLVVFESLFITLVGYIFGIIFGRLGMMLISRSTSREYKMSFEPFEVVVEQELLLLVVAVSVGLISALIPSIRAYQLNISKTLSNG